MILTLQWLVAGFSQAFYFIIKSHESAGLYEDYHTTWIGRQSTVYMQLQLNYNDNYFKKPKTFKNGVVFYRVVMNFCKKQENLGFCEKENNFFFSKTTKNIFSIQLQERYRVGWADFGIICDFPCSTSGARRIQVQKNNFQQISGFGSKGLRSIIFN